jgi:phenylalanyl-tRNA synthetase beta chain
MRLAGLNFRPASVLHLREGQSAAIFMGDQEVGTIGRLADSVSAEYKFRQPVFVAELDLTILLDLPETPVRYSPIARYPSVVRDSSFVVSRSTSFDDVKQAIASNAPELCRNAVFVAVYEGTNLPQGKKSLTLRFEYRADDRTLTDNEVDALHEELVGKLRAILDADLRV